MAFRIDNDVEFLGTIAGGNGGQGNLIIGQAASVNRRTPADVMNTNDQMIIKIEESGQHETTLCTLISSTEMVRTRVLDRYDRTGALTTPVQSLNLQKVNFSNGTLNCIGSIPQPLNITLQPDGTFAYTDAIRASVFYDLVADIQDPLSNIADNQVVFAVAGLVASDELGGLFLYDAGGDEGTVDDLDIFDAGTVGNPRAGILIRQRIDAAAAFFREDLSIYPPTTVARQKIFALPYDDAAVANAWMASRVQRGADGNGAYTDFDITARDRQASEVPFLRARSYGSAFDFIDFLKPLGLPSVALLTDLKSGMLSRVAADEKLYYYDPNRGRSEILLSDGGARGRVATAAALRLLTPDGYNDNDYVDVDGYLSSGDGAGFRVYWSSGSTTADDGIDVFKPTAHFNTSSWTEAGRFLRFAPLRNQTFTNSDPAPVAVSGCLWTTAATVPAGGYTNIIIGNNRMIILRVGATASVLKHNANGSAGRFDLPQNADYPLTPNMADLLLYQENGVVSILASGAVGENATAFVDGDTTPDITGIRVFKTANTSPIVITDFDGGVNGDWIEIHFEDGNTTIQHNANIKIRFGVDFAAAQFDVLTCRLIGGVWRCS